MEVRYLIRGEFLLKAGSIGLQYCTKGFDIGVQYRTKGIAVQ